MSKGLLLFAIPDDQTGLLGLGANHMPKSFWPNVLVFNTRVRRVLRENGRFLRVNNADKLQTVDADWVINFCADADEYFGFLTSLDQFAKREGALKGHRRPMFNQPEAVLATRRDKISQTLQDIRHLATPKCVRIFAKTKDALADQIANSGLEFPLLVRPVRSQTGHGLVKADDEAGLSGFLHFGQDCYVTTFVDARAPDGDYAKFRVAIVGRKWHVRHVHFGQNWQVHNAENSTEKTVRELALVKELRSDARLAAIMDELIKRVPLDYWGVDLGYQGPNKDYVFFEGNPAMSMLFNSKVPTGKSFAAQVRRKKIDVANRMEADLLALLKSPDQWRSMARDD